MMSRSLYEQWTEYRQKQERLDELTKEVERASMRRDYLRAAQLREEVLRLRDELERSPLHVLEPAESYHTWLPDYKWHADLDWAHLPVWLKRDRQALNDLFVHRKQVNGKYISYRVVDNSLMRKLHDSFPVIALEARRERYHEWLPDHKWHDDLDWAHLPVWLKRDRQALNDLFVHRKQVNGKYVSYKVVGNRLMRKLKDGVPVVRPKNRLK